MSLNNGAYTNLDSNYIRYITNSRYFGTVSGYNRLGINVSIQGTALVYIPSYYITDSGLNITLRNQSGTDIPLSTSISTLITLLYMKDDLFCHF